MNKIIIYTDGACFGNPGPGGYGAVLIWGEKRKELSGGFRLTTNNRMEILAAIMALEAIKTDKRYSIVIHTDSRLMHDTITKGWAVKWRANGWKRNKKDKALNPDLWERLLNAIELHDVEFKWVKAHAGIPENERCDELSKDAASGFDLAIDEEYELTKK